MQGIKGRGEAETMHALQASQPNVPPVMMAPTQFVGTPFDFTAATANNPPPVPGATGFRPQQFGFNFTLTNVPGVTWKQYICGKEVEATLGTLMLGGNLGLGVGVGSMAGKMIFGFTADPRLMPDIEQLRDLTAQAFRELTTEARSAG